MANKHTANATLNAPPDRQSGQPRPAGAALSGDDAPLTSHAGAPGYGSAGAQGEAQPGQGVEAVPGYDKQMATAAGRAERMRALGGAPEAAESDAPPLDAWYADLPARPDTGLLELVQEVLIDVVDDRVQVTATSAYPWRCICALAITAADGSRWIGTGFFVGPRTVITAGHCVYIHARGGWASSIELIPGADGAARPFGAITSSDLRSVRGWVERRLRSHDYGAIILPQSYRRGEEIGHFGYVSLPDAELAAVTANLAGYPGDKPRNTQWFHARELTRVEERTITYPIDTMGGQSGAPVWRLKDGQRHVVGIHTNGDAAGNSATRVCAPVLANIRRWIEAAG